MTLTGPSFGLDGATPRGGGMNASLLSGSVTLPINLPGPLKLELTLGFSIGVNAALRKNGGALGPVVGSVELKKG